MNFWNLDKVVSFDKMLRVSWKFYRPTKILSWNVTKCGLFFQYSLVLLSLDPTGQKCHQQQIWHHHMNFSTHPSTVNEWFMWMTYWKRKDLLLSILLILLHVNTYPSFTTFKHETEAYFTLLAGLRISWLYLLQKGKTHLRPQPQKRKDGLDMTLNCI